MDSLGHAIQIAIFFILALWFYLLPAYLAYKKGHPYYMAIFWLNLLTGWTVCGWIGALVWTMANPNARAGG